MYNNSCETDEWMRKYSRSVGEASTRYLKVMSLAVVNMVLKRAAKGNGFKAMQEMRTAYAAGETDTVDRIRISLYGFAIVQLHGTYHRKASTARDQFIFRYAAGILGALFTQAVFSNEDMISKDYNEFPKIITSGYILQQELVSTTEII